MEQTNGCKFGSKGYPYAQVVNIGHKPFDIYITYLYGQSIWSRRARKITNWLERTQLILPVEGYEFQYWEDAVRLFRKLESPKIPGHEWDKDRFFIIVTNVPPRIFGECDLPLLSIDITNLTLNEVRMVIFSLNRLATEGFGRSLFRQDLSLLQGANTIPRQENALDILALPVLVIPSLTIDFKYFKQIIRDRFDSVCEETLLSREGTASYSEILEIRKRLKEMDLSFSSDEEMIRMFWD